MTLGVVWQIVLGVFAVVGFAWTATQLYNHRFVKRPQLLGSVYRGYYPEHPRSGHDELLILMQHLHAPHWTELLDLDLDHDERRNAAPVLAKVRESINQMTEGLGAPNLSPSVRAFFIIDIKNTGSTTLQTVRLLSNYGHDVLVVSHSDERQFLEKGDDPGKPMTVQVGTLQPDDRVIIYGRCRHHGFFVGPLKHLRLTHADGRGRLIDKSVASLPHQLRS